MKTVYVGLLHIKTDVGGQTSSCWWSAHNPRPQKRTGAHWGFRVHRNGRELIGVFESTEMDGSSLGFRVHRNGLELVGCGSSERGCQLWCCPPHRTSVQNDVCSNIALVLLRNGTLI
ncbi:hypothetical protein AVEN_256707-1 [Araneus ventricosus]|uniref:Uncharacterized protein n=1 Tax=Araneus ventricosus TaxID=182803 RepID=A0A4Y2RQ77_ARAVE|nr:hypothetical protein AVEN_256707-1 [Araneus ventricosus]